MHTAQYAHEVRMITHEDLDFIPVTLCYLGGVATQKKPNATANFKFGTGFFRFFFGFFLVFFRFFSVFFGFSILANFDWFNGFLLSGSFC